MLMRDFKCPDCEQLMEKYVKSDQKTCECEYCGGTAERMYGMPRVVLEGITGQFPGAHDRWARIREENARMKARRS